MTQPFADRLIEAVRRLRTPLCVGLDPFPDRIPALFGDARTDIRAVAAFCDEIMALARTRTAVVKPQLGLFEAYGAEGYALARTLTAEAQTKGFIVILDAKRGDIGSTAEGYARACLGPAPGFGADAVTVNPYPGRDALQPFIDLAARDAKGVVVLVRTSNPGARDIQDLAAAGEPVWAHVARLVAQDTARLVGASGWSGLMAVAGATWPEQARRLREILPRALFLVPGYGAQGATAADAVAGFVPGPNGREGGVISSSRAVLYPPGAEAAKDLPAWRACVAAAMDRANSELREVLQH